MRRRRVPIAAGLLLLSACTPAVERPAAPAGAPVATPAPDLSIPYSASQPRFVLTVEPLKVGALGTAAATAASAPPVAAAPAAAGEPAPPDGPTGAPPSAAAADLVSAAVTGELLKLLARVGNFSVIDYAHFTAPGADHRTLLGPGEVGPFVVRGVVREFSEVVAAHQQRRSGGWLGGLIGIAGGAAGVPGAGAAGAGVSLLNPTLESGDVLRTGSVAIDLQLVDDASGRLLGLIAVKQKAVNASSSSGGSVLGFADSSSTSAASAVDEATRLALNDAVRQLYDALVALGLSPEPVRRRIRR